MKVLHLSAVEARLDVQLQSNQAKDQLDRFVLNRGSLGGKRVNGVLMNEIGSRQGQCVVGKFVESVQRGCHGASLSRPSDPSFFGFQPGSLSP